MQKCWLKVKLELYKKHCTFKLWQVNTQFNEFSKLDDKCNSSSRVIKSMSRLYPAEVFFLSVITSSLILITPTLCKEHRSKIQIRRARDQRTGVYRSACIFVTVCGCIMDKPSRMLGHILSVLAEEGIKQGPFSFITPRTPVSRLADHAPQDSGWIQRAQTAWTWLLVSVLLISSLPHHPHHQLF